MASAKDALFLGALGLVPRNLLSRAVGAAAHAPLPRPITRASIWAFARLYGIDVSEAERAPSEYRTAGEFFTRRLRKGARVVDQRPGLAISPADGRVANVGRIADNRLMQAKGRTYDLADLLRDRGDAERFQRGSWMTIYLGPRDYHRVHHPVEGRITGARYVPGHLWPVNRAAVENIDDLFCINERIITFVDSPLGEVATIMIGATSVGYITVSYDDDLQSNRGRPSAYRAYDPPRHAARGAELGVFNLGSTVVLLFADPDVELEPLAEQSPILMGQPIARRASGSGS